MQPTMPLHPTLRAFRIYCSAVSAAWMCLAFYIITRLTEFRGLGATWEWDPIAVLLFGSVFVLAALFLSVVHIAAMATPPSPEAWKIKAVVLGLDLTTLILWPLALPLLVFWFKPEIKALHGITGRLDAPETAIDEAPTDPTPEPAASEVERADG
jgi:hypothetical protein